MHLTFEDGADFPNCSSTFSVVLTQCKFHVEQWHPRNHQEKDVWDQKGSWSWKKKENTQTKSGWKKRLREREGERCTGHCNIAGKTLCYHIWPGRFRVQPAEKETTCLNQFFLTTVQHKHCHIHCLQHWMHFAEGWYDWHPGGTEHLTLWSTGAQHVDF